MADLISDVRLAEIKAGLEGVTPGPWTVDPDEREYHGEASIVGYDIQGAGQSVVGCEGIDGSGEKVAAHIARLDPQTVSIFIARLEAAENLVRDLRASLVLNGDAISMHKAVALSNRVEAHFALVAKAEG